MVHKGLVSKGKEKFRKKVEFLKLSKLSKLARSQPTDDDGFDEQAHEFQNLFYDLRRKGMDLTNTFLVACLIKKLPSSLVV